MNARNQLHAHANAQYAEFAKLCIAVVLWIGFFAALVF